jgi:dTMP kinase
VSRGRFITFEGGEGVGKSTQIRRLAARLSADLPEVVAPGAEAIRDLVLRGAADRWSPVTETLLMYAARRDHIERVIRPALARGAWVVCDRYADSTRAYQGTAGGTDPGLILAMEQYVLEEARPDLTLVFDLEPELGLERALYRAGAPRLPGDRRPGAGALRGDRRKWLARPGGAIGLGSGPGSADGQWLNPRPIRERCSA